MNFRSNSFRFLALLVVLIATAGLASAAGDPHGGGHGAPKLPLHAPPVLGPLTSSIIMCWIAVGLIVLFAKAATKKMSLIPSGFQNFAEWLFETLYDFYGSILGEHLVKRTFWFFGSVFVFIVLNNYLGLFPGVGTIGLEGAGENLKTPVFHPFLRGANADLNLTAAMAFTFAILWFYWAITENGFKGFLAHIFAPKGDFKGPLLVMMIVIFLLVGFLEVISIAIRPVALSFRLYGNIYGGEQTLESLMHLGGGLAKGGGLSFLPALPFLFVELLVGLVQALVFTLLCSVFLALICDHDHGDEHEH